MTVIDVIADGGRLAVVDVTKPCPTCNGRASSCPPFTRKMCDTGGRVRDPQVTQQCRSCKTGCRFCGWRGWNPADTVTVRSWLPVLDRDLVSDPVRFEVELLDMTGGAPGPIEVLTVHGDAVWQHTAATPPSTPVNASAVFRTPCGACTSLRRLYPALAERPCIASTTTVPQPGEWVCFGYRVGTLAPVIGDDDRDPVGSYVSITDGRVVVWSPPEYWSNERDERDVTQQVAAVPQPGQFVLLDHQIVTYPAPKIDTTPGGLTIAPSPRKRP